jgi:ABC-type antimicrobial peptide transport system permease subunit
LGILGSIPVVGYFFKNPIVLSGNAAQTMIEMGMEPLMYFSISPFVFYNQAIIVFLITVIIGVFPIYRAYELRVNQALRA